MRAAVCALGSRARKLSMVWSLWSCRRGLSCFKPCLSSLSISPPPWSARDSPLGCLGAAVTRAAAWHSGTCGKLGKVVSPATAGTCVNSNTGTSTRCGVSWLGTSTNVSRSTTRVQSSPSGRSGLEPKFLKAWASTCCSFVQLAASYNTEEPCTQPSIGSPMTASCSGPSVRKMRVTMRLSKYGLLRSSHSAFQRTVTSSIVR
mmetsp:Transcript_20896/g.53096  ORF Transcript_20896/g.53096 Transcript_20896/m.53096 type:complete len:203 (-) Transcript_20896:1655-2263(-)